MEKNIRELIIIGEAKHVTLLGEKNSIPMGFKRIEDDYIYYYTGKGLREIFNNSDMNEEQKMKAKKLELLSEDELMKQLYVRKININEIIKIE